MTEYRCPEYDGVSDQLSQREFLQRFRAIPAPARFAMIKDDQEREQYFRIWLREQTRKGRQMELAVQSYEESERRYR